MALNEILGSAVSGLAAAQAGLRAVSNNIANVGVTGYARQRVDLTTGVVSGNVNGVVVGEPTRIADKFLEATVYRRASDFGRADVSSSYLDRLQALLGTPGSTSGLPARLDAVNASAVAMTGSQASAQTVAQFTSDVQDAISSMQQLNSDVEGLRGDVESEVGYSVDRINGLLRQIYDLNGTISQATALGRTAAGSADQRMNAIQELSSLMAVTVREQPDGRVTLETPSGAALLDKKLRQLSYPTGGQGVSQPIYPNIDIRFADDNGGMGAATGDKIDSAAIGGKLGGLLDLRDRALPNFTEQLGVLFGGMAEALNSVSNAGTTVPAPAKLEGRATGLIGTDRLGFTGKADFAVTKSDGTLVARTTIDFDALGPGATVNDLRDAINAGLGGNATATFANGKLTITSNTAGNGVVVAQDAAKPSARAGVGVSQFFGLNDLVRSDTSTLVPSGFKADPPPGVSDPHGFTTGETTQIVLRDPSGRALTSYTLKPTTGGTFADIVSDLNASPLADFGKFNVDDRGRLRFQPLTALAGATLSIPSDSTQRGDTGRTLSSLMGLTGNSNGLTTAAVTAPMFNDATKVPLARLQPGAVGAKVLGAGDLRGATDFIDRLTKTVDLGKDGVATVDQFSSLFLGRTGLEASQSKGSLANATARRDDAVSRRDSFSGVNVDEELSQMVVLQNSYSAAARVITTATQMYDTLLAMVK